MARFTVAPRFFPMSVFAEKRWQIYGSAVEGKRI